MFKVKSGRGRCSERRVCGSWPPSSAAHGTERARAMRRLVACPTLVRKRLGWLVLLFLGQLLTLNAMGFFADQLAQMVALCPTPRLG